MVSLLPLPNDPTLVRPAMIYYRYVLPLLPVLALIANCRKSTNTVYEYSGLGHSPEKSGPIQSINQWSNILSARGMALIGLDPCSLCAPSSDIQYKFEHTLCNLWPNQATRMIMKSVALYVWQTYGRPRYHGPWSNVFLPCARCHKLLEFLTIPTLSFIQNSIFHHETPSQFFS